MTEPEAHTAGDADHRRGPSRTRDWGRLARSFTAFVFRRYLADQCVQTASALTYTTLLALVPLMTITIGIISAFPGFAEVQTRIQSALFDFLVPQVGAAVQEHLLAFTANAGRMTGVGLLVLIATSILLLSTIEMAFNRIWRVQRARGLVVRLLSFWTVLSLSPLLAAASLSLTTRFIGDQGLEGSQIFMRMFVGGLPLLFELVGFSVLYLVLPNRPVRWADAVAGGAVAAVLFEISKAGFALYLTWFPIYETIYGALSTVPIFLVWLYLAWSVVLIGAVVTAALPDFRAGRQLGGAPESLLPGPRLTLAVAVIDALSQAGRGGVPLSRRTLQKRVPVAMSALDGTLETLARGRFTARTSDDRWVLTRDLQVTTLKDLMAALGIGLRGPVCSIESVDGPWTPRLARWAEEAIAAEAAVVDRPLADLVAHDPGAEVRPLERPAVRGPGR